MLTSGRTTNILLIAMIAVGIGIVAMLASGARGGPLDPPAAPAPTGVTKIFQPASCAGFPIVLGVKGSYELAGDITGCGGVSGIEITANDVSLDLKGFSVVGGGSGTGVRATVAVQRLAISNGKVAGWVGNAVDVTNASESRFSGLQVSYNGGNGIMLGTNSTLTDCISSYNGSSNFGADIRADFGGSVVRHCTVSNSYDGIRIGGSVQVIGNLAQSNGTGIYVTGCNVVVDGNSAIGNLGKGFDMALTACAVTLTRNIAHVNAQGNYSTYLCTGCDIGPIGSAAAATSPWANIDN